MAIELVGLGEVMKKATQNGNTVLDLNDLQAQFLAKEKAAEAALETAEKATEAAEELRIKLAEAVAKTEETSEAKAEAAVKKEAAGTSAETKEQKIARLKKELNELEATEEKPAATTDKETTPKPTAKVEAEKLNVTSAPKAEVAVEAYEPESPKAGAKGAAARRK